VKVLATLVVSIAVLASCSQKNNDFDPDTIRIPVLGMKGAFIEPIETKRMSTNKDDALPADWFNKIPEIDGVEGVGTDKAYAEFELNPEGVEPIIVAVIDSGVDIHHEDLQGRIWTNPGETGKDEKGNDKATNGLDDDENGYVDDVYGWNYIGGKDGRHIDHETLELTREMVRFEARIANGEVLDYREKEYFDKLKEAYEEGVAEAKRVVVIIEPINEDIAAAKIILKNKLGMTEFNRGTIEGIQSEDEDVLKAKETLMAAINRFGSLARFGRIYNYYSSQLKYYYNKEFNPRAEIVGDDPSDFEDTIYGNNDVIGPDASHGTHVAGIIAAVRDNDLGIKGVATNVQIMVLRVVPNGDERDKDVALSVRYAADKGARIINMSFGKGYSPYKREVDDAFQYAADKNVLLVHAAGNDNQNSDSIRSFPHKWKKDRNGLHLNSIPGWLEIGASTAYKGLNLPLIFQTMDA
jgi:cell wall-associated protease